MFNQAQKSRALEFARALARRDYAQAYSMLSTTAQSVTTLESMREQFETMIPLDWGDVNPIELEENAAWDEMFLYVVLGGPVYSEAIIVNSFAPENGQPMIASF